MIFPTCNLDKVKCVTMFTVQAFNHKLKNLFLENYNSRSLQLITVTKFWKGFSKSIQTQYFLDI
jgi:hypothetical protein